MRRCFPSLEHESRQLCDHAGVFEPGSRSKQIVTFMLPADEAAFGETIAPALEGFARWETHERGNRIVPHESLQAAMEHDGAQAYLRLLAKGGGSTGPIIQYFHTRVWMTADGIGPLTGKRYRPKEGEKEEMQPGRLAYKWFPETEFDCIQKDFPDLAALAWKALQKVTSPHIENMAGKPLRSYRIGPAAKAWLRADPERLLRDCSYPLRVRGSAGAGGS